MVHYESEFASNCYVPKCHGLWTGSLRVRWKPLMVALRPEVAVSPPFGPRRLMLIAITGSEFDEELKAVCEWSWVLLQTADATLLLPLVLWEMAPGSIQGPRSNLLVKQHDGDGDVGRRRSSEEPTPIPSGSGS